MRSSYDLASDRGVDWKVRAACRGLPPEWWEAATNANRAKLDQNERARKICRHCPVKAECQEQADRLGAAGMIVAGKTWNSTRRYPTAGISMQCSRPGCVESFTTSSNGRRRYCSKRCKQVEYERVNGRRRKP